MDLIDKYLITVHTSNNPLETREIRCDDQDVILAVAGAMFVPNARITIERLEQKPLDVDPDAAVRRAQEKP